jgi:hypothetical protein
MRCFYESDRVWKEPSHDLGAHDRRDIDTLLQVPELKAMEKRRRSGTAGSAKPVMTEFP